ncbi:zinc finger and BTB domain-containing protein 4-like [Penaeus monodon]|uniref:zinc finger and BTB domain-containing protein 4-like n=1 Tax=Penaeus monodon TaxID=6687 RepID=UPI0018A7A95F|nr:zinc finger and BTB domain-containing protein 4-like [Penaeus monodon]
MECSRALAQQLHGPGFEPGQPLSVDSAVNEYWHQVRDKIGAEKEPTDLYSPLMRLENDRRRHIYEEALCQQSLVMSSSVCEEVSRRRQKAGGDKADIMDTWNCSICRRRLSSRAKSEQPASSEGSTLAPAVPPVISSPLPPPSPGAPTALNLFSGLAAMASSMASAQSQQAGKSSAPPPTTSAPALTTAPTSAPAPATHAPTPTSALTTTPSTPTTAEAPPTANGFAHRKSSRAYASQKSLDRTRSIERARSRDESRDRRPPPGTPVGEPRRNRDRSRERTSVPRRRSDNDDDPPRAASRASSVRRGRMSDYMLRDSSEEHLSFHRIHAAHSETDVSRSRKQSYANLQVTRPLENANVLRTAAEDVVGTRESESSGDEILSVDNWRSRGRRRSIVRQQSYEEEDGDGETFASPSSNSLTLWGGGDLPARRHSSQDPSRRDDSLEGRRTRDSLDVPHNRVHRHHSWDYDVTRDTLPM